jgi:outer membrane receptor protein involved in Fe transport
VFSTAKPAQFNSSEIWNFGIRKEMQSIRVICSGIPLLLFASQSVAQESTEIVEVVGQTPLGAGIDVDEIASNVQLATAEDLREQRALDMADFMKRSLASVFVNEAQNNPLQPDVQYRGFVGSPLLGLPQGIAVYQDGVRVNEPFGDTVNWALIPDSAIETVYLMPGSNPLFGLNALGGAIAIETKDGFSNAGTRAEFYGGSFGRVGLQAETGGSTNDRFSYFLTGSYLEEDGWRDFSPSEATQLFGNLGWRRDATTIDVNLTLADTDLIGNGAAPVELLDIDREAIFTRPDQTENELSLVNVIAEHEISSTLSLTGNVYLRSSDISTYNGDDSDFEECEDNPGFICEEEDDEEELIFDQNDNPIPASDEVEGATVNRTNTKQDSVGFGFQASWSGDLGGRDNLFVLGTSYDDSSVDFDASSELGELDETRQAVPSGFFIGEAFTRLKADTTSLSLYFSNTFTLSDAISLTVSGRYNDIDVTLRDQLGTALDGDHNFDRFNPAIGVTARLANDLTFYAGYSESNRAPSPVELTCADEDDPCRLPNAFLADPPLEQVVAETFEAGFRGAWNSGNWHAGVFRTTNKDDILFISAGALTNEGFFDNVGRTRRDGIEVNLDGKAGDSIDWFVNYTFLDATFMETLSFPSPNNPVAIDGEVTVQSGDRLPLIPRQLFKGGVRASIGDRVTVGGEILSGGEFHMRGDEGNDLARIGDYTVLNLRGDYRVNENMRVFLNIDNVLDEEYETFGLFGEADEVLGDDFEDSRFLSPAAPRAAWLGVQIAF